MNTRKLTLNNVLDLISEGMLWDQNMQITDTIAADLTAHKQLIDTKRCGMDDELIGKFYSNTGKIRRDHADEDPILVIITDPEDGTYWMNYLFPHA